MEGRRRVTLYDQMASAVDIRRDSLGGSTLDAVMASRKRAAEPSRRQLSSSRTLMDIMREDDSNKKDRRSWKVFRDKLRLMAAGSAWFSATAIHIAASDIAIPNQNTSNYRLNSDAPSTSSRPGEISTPRGSPSPAGESRLQISRPASFRRDGAVTFRDYLDSDDDGSDYDDWDAARGGTRRLSTIISEERALSAREAEAAAAAVEPARMSLMDLLEETDRHMGFEGTRYRVGDDGENRNEKDEEEGEEEEVVEENYRIEENCCVCMVRHKGAAFIPCGHTFCRQCSRELWVSRGHCPLCNNSIVEILDLF